MYYYNIYLRNVPHLYTWQSEASLPIGARVELFFRKKRRIGIVIEAVSLPEFVVQNIEKVFEKNFVTPPYINLAKEMAEFHFTPLPKILNLMIPEAFLQKESPEKYESFYRFKTDLEVGKRWGKNQLEFLNLMTGRAFSLSEIPVKLKTVFRHFLKNNKLNFIRKDLICARLPNFKLANLKHNLTPLQKTALLECLESKLPVLLWGITGSGKTEVYKRYLFEKLKADDQALLLVPEINLTPQLIGNFEQLFPGKIAVWHSNLTAKEKVQEWKRLQTGAAKILIGTRSAVFVPIPKLKAMVLDEEHEWTYKNEFSPRYWTHDVVEKLAQKFDAGVIFGSATPKLATYFKVDSGEYNLVKLNKRVFETALPSIEIVDLKNEVKKGNFSPISEKLQLALHQTFAGGHQAVIFLNKRGYSASLLCKVCGHTFQCSNCDLPMKLHKGRRDVLLCHACGQMEIFRQKCPQCANEDFNFKGWGTQQVEECLGQLFPGKRIIRADRDSVTGRYDFEKILSTFSAGEADILLGTQMVAKGLDFEKVKTVGVVLADVGLNLPDHSAEERVFHLLEQVAGRAGRRALQGQIVVQTYNPENELFRYLKNHDVRGFLDKKLQTHGLMNLPPFTQFVKIIFSHEQKATAFGEAFNFFKECQEKNIEHKMELLINWAPAFFPRMHNKYWFHVFLNHSSSSVLQNFLTEIKIPSNAKIDRDPVTLL